MPKVMPKVMPKSTDPPKPQQSPYNDSHWVPGTVKVMKQFPQKQRLERVEGFTYAGLAVHPCREGSGNWMLTAVKCGCPLTAVGSKESAMRLGDVVWKKLWKDIREHDSPYDLKAALPEWVARWLHQCRMELTNLDPKPFEEAE